MRDEAAKKQIRRGLARRRTDIREVRVGLLGLGTVGCGVVEILHRHGALIAQRADAQIRVVRALVRRPRRRRPGAAAHVKTTTRPEDILEAQDIDVVVELLGGIEPARSFICRALTQGKPVVTANKAVLAAHGGEILRLARKRHADLYFEAAVAGGLPIIRTLREGLAGDRIVAVAGILNGTTNYILEAMSAGQAYAGALSQAQRLGFAEADPTLDVSGRDAADKLAVLIRLAFGTELQAAEIPTTGITGLDPEVLADARALGYRVKLLATARRHGVSLDARVHPTFVPTGHVLSTVPAAQNAVAVVSEALGMSLYQGAGAGGLPTGSAVVSDIIEITRNLRAGISGRLMAGASQNAPRLMRADAAESAYYLRLLVTDRPGVLASVSKILAAHSVSLATVLQLAQGDDSRTPVPVILTTHRTKHGSFTRALRAIERLETVRAPAQIVRIETNWPGSSLAQML